MRRRALPLFVTILAAAPAIACGPDFPNNLLSGGDAAALVAPEGNFARELARMNLATSRFQASERPKSERPKTFAAEAAEAEASDLQAALKKAKVPKPELETILKAQLAARASLTSFVDGPAATEDPQPPTEGETPAEAKPAPAPPKFPPISIPEGLPPEFADYFEGALAWHNPAVLNKSAARANWERLLERPAAERHFKSTWGAFMLARSWEEDSPEKAIQYYQQVRTLAREGFADSAGLAAASLGQEARVDLHGKKYEAALELYLEQLATGSDSALISLRFVAAEVLRQPLQTLVPLAKNPRTQRVITAYTICRPLNRGDLDEEDGKPPIAPDAATRNWLAAVEAAGVKDVDSAEKLALAAYRVNDMKLAQRWIQRAPGSPVAQWLQAKLWLRAGKLNEAAATLARVVPSFPIEPHGTNEVVPTALKDTLYVDAAGCCPDRIPAEQQVLGEMGVLRLARREYSQALDALFNAGFWMDAAYVAERVLTADELKAYVDAYWPPVSAEQAAAENEKYGNEETSPALLREKIRYLLARRLVRLLRADEAREYYPAEFRPAFNALVEALKTGWDESRAVDQRAKDLFQAAFMLRTNGMELIGTEVEPDWHFHMGDYEEGVTAGERATNEAAQVLVASRDELARAARHQPDPEARFHYRYQAASLAWEAAKLMPNNSDETAKVLWTAGCWLKNRDPKAADLFYKALVRRNRKTALGAEADHCRWFPELDADGNIIPRQPRPAAAEGSPGSGQSETSDAVAPPGSDMAPPLETPGSAQPPQGLIPSDSATAQVAGYEYIVQPGDSLARIAQAAELAGLKITLRDIHNANPGLDSGRLKIGQKLFIPAPAE
jgi:hypothetical protein